MCDNEVGFIPQKAKKWAFILLLKQVELELVKQVFMFSVRHSVSEH